MELRLEIKLASVEELAGVAKALSGLQVGEVKPAKPAKPAIVTTQEQFEETEGTGEDEMEEVPSPFTAHPPEETPAPAPTVKAKAASTKQTAAEAKAAKKAQEEADRKERVERLKASMEQNKEIADEALARRSALNTPTTTLQEEPIESIVNEIKALGDQLMGFTGMALEAKQKLTSEVMAKVGVPAGVRPTQLQQPMLGQFRDLYRSSVQASVNPVMGGLV